MRQLAKDEVAEMEEHRCKIVASEMEDSRLKSLPNSEPIQLDDPRYEGLRTRDTIKIEDCRFNSVAIAMEDPRCRSMHVTW
jgi:hypothetical protein